MDMDVPVLAIGWPAWNGKTVVRRRMRRETIDGGAGGDRGQGGPLRGSARVAHLSKNGMSHAWHWLSKASPCVLREHLCSTSACRLHSRCGYRQGMTQHYHKASLGIPAKRQL